MESMESCVPPGFRFHPTDEELIGYYLRKKIASQKIDLDVIREIDLYRIEPWDLQERCRIGYEEQNEWYFFSHKDKKYPTGTRTNRATMAGFWKATGRDKAVYDKKKLIGMRKTLVFYKGRAPNGQKTDWIMHEYRLESDENGPPQEEGWVVCRAFRKRINGHSSKSIEGWEPEQAYFYDEPSGMSSVFDPTNIDCIPRHVPHSNFSSSFPCKQETEGDNLNFINNLNSDGFLQLPQLESPSLPLMKRPLSSVSEEEPDAQHIPSKRSVTDWRALDKFVASQLSQEERYSTNNRGEDGDNPNNSNNDFTASFAGGNGSSVCSDQMAWLLLQSGGRDETNINGNSLVSGFLSSGADCDIGICIFDK